MYLTVNECEHEKNQCSGIITVNVNLQLFASPSLSENNVITRDSSAVRGYLVG